MQVVSFKQRVINSSLWTFGGSAMTQLIRFFSNLVMTRLLAPEMFGLMAVASVFILGLHLLSDVGLRQIIIQNKRSDDIFINTIWTMQVIRGWMIWGVSILVGLMFLLLNLYNFWPVNSVYAHSTFPYIIAAIGFNSVISGYESTKLILANRNLQLKITVSIGLVSQLLGISSMLAVAYFYPTVWALVFGGAISAASQVIFSYVFIQGNRNHFCLNKEVISEVIHFGKWIFVSSILGFLSSSSDKLLLGGLVSSQQLGYYAIAGLLVGAIGQLITTVIHSVGFPALSETFRNHPEKLKSVFYKLRLPFDLFLLFSCGFLFSTANLVVTLLYDARYISVAWILQIMAIGLFELRYRMAGECFLAMGMPKLQTSLIFVTLLALYILGLVAYHFYDFNGVVWAVTCASLFTIPLNLYYLKKFKLLDWQREFMVLPILVVGYFLGRLVTFMANTYF